MSTPRSMHTSKSIRYTDMKSQMFGSHDRPTLMNTSAVVGAHPMSNAVYGFRPEFGWPGVLFQVFLQEPFVTICHKQKDLEFWIAFEGNYIPAVFHEMESDVSLPDMGAKRYILQSVIPSKVNQERCPITLVVLGSGGKTVVNGLLVGYFNYRPNGICFHRSCL
jgi:hypothetical protein